MNKISFFNIEIHSLTLKELLDQLDKGVVITPNVDHLVKLQKDKEFLACYKAAEWVICDSNIVKLAAKFLGKKIKETIPGSSFLPAFYNHHKANKNISIFLLGSADGVATKAMQNINRKVGRNIVTAAHSPSYGFEKKEKECTKIIDIINKSGANVLVIGVGAPKQEKWIMKYKSQLTNVDLFLALGATIDFEAGHKKRAPKILQKLYLEWLYRLYKEPTRLWRRYLVEDIFFVFMVLQEKLKISLPRFIDTPVKKI